MWTDTTRAQYAGPRGLGRVLLGVATDALLAGDEADRTRRNRLHIRHNIEKALAYSNASGLGWERTEMQRLAETLSPYWKWNRVAIWHCGHLDDRGRAQPKGKGPTRRRDSRTCARF